jgi:2-oxoacid:acceptor oxidoreductase, beta subunit, pyruvate/2-ketoisovalerate family
MLTDPKNDNHKIPVIPTSLSSNELNDWCPGCVSGETKILSVNGLKEIALVKEGEQVLGHDGLYHKVIKTMSHLHHGKIFKISINGTNELLITEEHPIFVATKISESVFELEWKPASKVSEGDLVAYPSTALCHELVKNSKADTYNDFEKEYTFFRISRKKLEKFSGVVYNLEVEDANSYVTEFAALHNCGDSGIVLAVKSAIAGAGLDPHKTVIVSGIGCSSKLPHLVNVNGVHTLHGRAIPFAEGIKLANPELNVLIDSGDGDTYGIGVGHFISAGRRNVNIKLFVHNNGVYALTKGQASPTLPEGRKVKGIPEPNINGPLNPLAIAILSGYTFVARTQSYNVKEQTDLMVKAIKHPGLALIDIQQGCPTYNPEFTNTAWFGQHLHPLPQDYDGIVHDPTNLEEVNKKKLQAINMILNETPENLNTGLFFQWKNQDTFEDRLAKRGIKPPLSQQIADADGKSTTDLNEVFKDLSV